MTAQRVDDPAGADDQRSASETILEVWVNCPDEATALAIADAMIEARLAAAANLYPPISSRYRWQGRIDHADEVPLLLKSRSTLFEALARRIAALHPYETPSIIGHAPSHVHAPYRHWIFNETEG